MPVSPDVTTVPDTLGRVIVRSAVGSTTVRVVSNESAVAPSNVICVSNTPTAAGAAHLTPLVSAESAVSTCPFVPTPNLAIALSAVPTSKSPFASAIFFVRISWPSTVAVAPSTTNPAFTLKSFVIVAIYYLLG